MITGLHMRERPADQPPPIDTIVLVMMENRSFDHLLGWMSLPGYDARRDVDGLKGNVDPFTHELTNPAYVNRAGSRQFRPYLAQADNWLVSDLPHGRDLVGVQMGPALTMDGFARAQLQENPKYPAGAVPDSLMMMPPGLVPATAFLARNFMVCDRWFSPIPTDTHPNRLMSLCGFTKIESTAGEPFPLPDHYSVLDWCEDAGLRWRVYREMHSFVTLFTALRPVALENPKQFRGISDLAHDFRDESGASFPHLILVEPTYSDDPFALHEKDLLGGGSSGSRRIPADNHPPNPMAYGEAFLAEVYRAVTANPERWKRTLMLLIYDEHGGFFDHVPPFRVTTSPPGDDAWKNPLPFSTSGPRVPAIVVSPLVAKGSVTSRRFDHTSFLQLLADVADPGRAYSEGVESRRQEGGIQRISDVLADEPLIEKPPPMPLFKLPVPGNAAPPRVVNRSMEAFKSLHEFLDPARRLLAAATPAASALKLGAPNYLAARNAAPPPGRTAT